MRVKITRTGISENGHESICSIVQFFSLTRFDRYTLSSNFVLPKNTGNMMFFPHLLTYFCLLLGRYLVKGFNRFSIIRNIHNKNADLLII